MTDDLTPAETVALINNRCRERIDQLVSRTRGKLSSAERHVMTDRRFNPKGWEPGNPKAPVVQRLIELGLFERANGVCLHETLEGVMIVPTLLGLIVRLDLMNEGIHS